jgi:chaperone required for assembly of F1-ATPase
MVEDKIRKAAALRPALPKRFYTAVSVGAAADGFVVVLDGRAIKTPKRRALCLPTKALAEAVAAEWEAQATVIDPATMPLTQLANTVIDGISETASAVAESFVTYARADLLCYRVAYPESLARAQAEAWQPVLDWAEARLGARFRVTTEISPIAQPEESIAAIRAACAAYDPWRLAALHTLAGVYGSAVLALAVLEGHLAADRASAVARVDEVHQASRWGEDAEACRRAEALAAEAASAARFAALVRRDG